MKSEPLPNLGQSHHQVRRSLTAVAVILPVYNEQAAIRRTFAAILEYLPTHPNYTFIFVNDGSCDRTKDIIYSGIAATQTKQIQLLSYHPNVGKGYAIQRGVEYADSDIICYLDSDLAYSLDHLDRLVQALRTHDVAIGCRSLVSGNSKDLKFSRKIAGRVSASQTQLTGGSRALSGSRKSSGEEG